MTPNARYQAAIEIIDEALEASALDKILTNWGRKHRFAGSKDRSAIRDIVFDVYRRRAEYCRLGGSMSGRGLVLGALIASQTDPRTVFNSEKFSPDCLTEQERDRSNLLETLTDLDNANIPEWLFNHIPVDLVPEFAAQRSKAALFLRVNVRKTSIAAACASLESDGVTAEPYAAVPNALIVTNGERRVKVSTALGSGLVEIQDAGSQAITIELNAPKGANSKILDYCAGGGGKSLAMAARSDAQIYAYDISEARMVDIKPRSKRAGVDIVPISKAALKLNSYDYVLIDVPCSGSGAWRRNPEAKWLFNRARLDDLCAIQLDILNRATNLTTPEGRVGYVGNLGPKTGIGTGDSR